MLLPLKLYIECQRLGNHKCLEKIDTKVVLSAIVFRKRRDKGIFLLSGKLNNSLLLFLAFYHFFAPYYIIWEQNRPLYESVSFTRCLPIAFTMFVHVSEREFFSKNSSKFAVECDWNSKISQTFKIWVFLKKLMRFFGKFAFYKTVKGDNIAVECVSNGNIFLKNVFSALIMRFYRKKNQIFLTWKNKKIYEKGVFFREKKHFHLLKAFFTKMGRLKICRW